jgi:hypothetical protein
VKVAKEAVAARAAEETVTVKVAKAAIAARVAKEAMTSKKAVEVTAAGGPDSSIGGGPAVV